MRFAIYNKITGVISCIVIAKDESFARMNTTEGSSFMEVPAYVNDSDWLINNRVLIYSPLIIPEVDPRPIGFEQENVRKHVKIKFDKDKLPKK